jgi:Zn-dependent peptidase ImmA (M78 family)
MIAAVPGKDTNVGAKRAREARAALGLSSTGPVPCILTTIEQEAGTPVVLLWLPEGIAGCVSTTAGAPLVWVNGTQAAARQRFTLAHEYGHLRCGHDGRLAVDTFETLSGVTTDSHEIQANAFAAEFLAPADGVRAMANGEPTLETVVLLAARFGLSTIAALYRLNTLSLTRRSARLKQEIEAGLDGEVWERLDPAVLEDVIGGLTEQDLPRLSPAIQDSALAALLAGTSSADAVARALGLDPARFAAGIELIGA